MDNLGDGLTRSVAIIGTRGYPSFYGGFETAVRKIAPFLADSGWDVTVYGRPGTTRTDSPGIDPRVVSTITRGLESKALSTLSFGLTASLDAAKNRPDAALVMNVANGYWLPLLRARGIPTVVNVDGIEWERAKWGRAARAVFRGGAVITAKSASTLVYDSDEIAKRWVDRYHRTGDVIAYGGEPVEELPLEPGLRHREYVLMVARFVPENSVGEFFEAARVVAEKYDVVLVGSAGYGGALDAEAQKLADYSPRVHWLGHVADDARLFSLWQHAGAYFHGHSVGGTNPALVQAMACGAPTVARETVYNREVLGEAGVFTAVDPGQIANAVMRLMADPVLQQSLSLLAKRRAAEYYTWQSICGKYERSLLAAIARKEGRSL